MTSGDYNAAAEVVKKYDTPMFKALIPLPGSFDAGMHAWSELTGIYKRWRRSPYYNLTDAEVEACGAELDKLGLLQTLQAPQVHLRRVVVRG